MTLKNETKKQKLVHPVWTHLPAVAALLAMAGYLIFSSPIPANAPVHFGFDGTPDAWGSPWLFIGIMLGLSVFFIGLSTFIDELWARQEKRKSFNWLSLLDELAAGWMAGMGVGYLATLHDNAAVFNFPWQYSLGVMGGALVLGVIVELFRPFRPFRYPAEAADNKDFAADINRRLKNNTQFVYWDYQNPSYVTFLAILLPLVFIATTVVIWAGQGWVLFTGFYFILTLVISLAAVFFIYSGQRVIVTREEVSVRWGLAGIKVLRLATAGIAGIELTEFSPLKDFGGYGIRFGKGITAYYLNGHRGVKISTADGKKYLIGSDHPERLLAVLEQLTVRKD
jgi:hypothetical protein